MKKNRAVSFIALILNLAIVGLAIYAGLKIFADGMVIGKHEDLPVVASGFSIFMSFTVCASALLALASLLMVPCCIASLVKGEYKVPLFFKGLKFMGVVAVLTTLTLNAISTIKPEFVFDFGGGNWFDFAVLPVLFIRLCLPVLAFLSFAFFEGGKKSNYGLAVIGILPAFVYVGVYVILAILGTVWVDFYQMKLFGPEVLGTANDVWYVVVIAIVLISLIFGTIVWAINRAVSVNKPVEVKSAEQPATSPMVSVVVNNNAPAAVEEKTEEEKPVEKKADWAREEEPEEKKVEEPAPAPAEEKPVEEKPAPAPVEEKPVEEKPAPAPVEEKPVEQPAPAPAPVVAPVVVPVPADDKPAEEVAAAEEEKKPVAAKKPAAKKPAAKKPAAKKEEEPKKAPYSTKVYHISKQQNSGKWQIKVAGAERALKLFDTQKDAIDYAKDLVKEKGGSYRVHSLQGKMRKA